MAMSSKISGLLIVCLFAISLAHYLVSAVNDGHHHHHKKGRHGPGSLNSSQCGLECTRRCGKTQYHKPCMFFCQKCCKKCLCVPPGYYGNKFVCPCYNNWKTKHGGPKCP